MGVVKNIKDLSERLMKYFPDGKFVKPKDKCKIGHSKEVCNRGDISNWIISEEINAEEAYSHSGSINTIIENKRDLGIVTYLTHEEKILLSKNNVNVLLMKNPIYGFFHILYRDKNKALKLKEIIEDNGKLDSENPETVREIGKLLGYDDNSIESYIRKRFGQNVLTEVKFGSIKHNNGDIDIYKNPVSIKRFPNKARGICLPSGDVYFVDDNKNIIHAEIAKQLYNRGIKIDKVNDYDYLNKGFIGVVKGNGNDVYFGESYDDNHLEDRKKAFTYILNMCKQKNPNLNFIYKSIKSTQENNLNEIQVAQILSNNKRINLFKNPPSIKNFPQLSRGVILPDGDIYMADNGYDIVHNSIHDALNRYGFYRTNTYNAAKTEYINVILMNNVLYFSDLYYPEILEYRKNYFYDVIKKFKIKNPKLKISYSNIDNMYSQDNDVEIFENNIYESNISNLNDLPFKDEIKKMGGNIFSVGGAVRDKFLGKESKDLDILITNVSLDRLEKLLSKYGRVNAVGKSFGILKFKPQGSNEEIDIAIPRTEQVTGVGGHKGFDVVSDHKLSIKDDLLRRDFTINAIAKDIDGNIIDPYNGIDDIKNKTIRMVNPHAFSDDPLRMLRAVQFLARFGFKIEEKTRQLIVKNVNKIKEIPPERILEEFQKIIDKGNPLMGAVELKSLGLRKEIFGNDGGLYLGKEWDNVRTMGEFIFLLSHNILKNPAEYYKNNLNGNIKTFNEIKALRLGFNNNETNPVKLRSIAHNMYLLSPSSLNSKILSKNIQKACGELLSGKYPKTINEINVNGNEIKKFGFEGEEIGKLNRELLILIYADKLKNNNEDLINFIKNKTNTNTSLNEDNSISYSAVVLDDRSHKKIIKNFGLDNISDGWKIIAHHMTICLGELPPEQKKLLGMSVRLEIDKIGGNDMVVAAAVNTTIKTKNALPHITLAINKHNGGKPVMSNYIKHWEKTPKFYVTGKIMEIPFPK